MGALKIKVGGQYITVRRGPRGPSGALTGEMKIWPVAAIPAGYLLCDGQAVPRLTYADLFAVIGTNHGVGDNSTTFNVPDMKLRIPIGAGAGKTLHDSDQLAEAARNARWSHSHNHTASASSSSSTAISGGVSGAGTGAWVDATNTDHNHAGSPMDHGVATNTPTSGGASRATGGAHASTATAAQAPGQVHAHGLSDPTHAHGHTIGATTTTTTTVTPVTADSGAHPFKVVNYIIKT